MANVEIGRVSASWTIAGRSLRSQDFSNLGRLYGTLLKHSRFTRKFVGHGHSRMRNRERKAAAPNLFAVCLVNIARIAALPVPVTFSKTNFRAGSGSRGVLQPAEEESYREGKRERERERESGTRRCRPITSNIVTRISVTARRDLHRICIISVASRVSPSSLSIPRLTSPRSPDRASYARELTSARRLSDPTRSQDIDGIDRDK